MAGTGPLAGRSPSGDGLAQSFKMRHAFAELPDFAAQPRECDAHSENGNDFSAHLVSIAFPF